MYRNSEKMQTVEIVQKIYKDSEKTKYSEKISLKKQRYWKNIGIE